MVSADPIPALATPAEPPEIPVQTGVSSPCHIVTPSPSQPLSPRDATLLQSLLSLRLDFTAFALKENLPADQLIDWAESAAIAPRLQALRRLANLALDIRHTQARRAAVDILESIATTAEDPIEKRRAASALLRRPDAPVGSAPPRLPSRGEGSEAGAIAHHRAPIRSPGESRPPCSPLVPSSLDHIIPAPVPDNTPESVANVAAEALFQGEPAAILTRLFPLLVPGAEICGKPVPPTPRELIASHADTPVGCFPRLSEVDDTLCRHERTTDAGEEWVIAANPCKPTERAVILTISPRLGRHLISAIRQAHAHPPSFTPNSS